MKSTKLKKSVRIVLWMIGFSAVVGLLSFVNAEQHAIKGKVLDIQVLEDDNAFIDADDIRRFLKDRNDEVVGKRMEQIDVHAMEKALMTHPAVAKAQVAADLNGKVLVEVKQRHPLVRVMTALNESFYLDDEATLMPLSENYAADVPVVNGYIFDRYNILYPLRMDEVKNERLLESIVLDDIYQMAKYLHSDSLMHSLIHQIYITEEKEMILVPILGNHKILVGDAKNLEEKMEKLKIFYKEGLNKVDDWNKYSLVNLKYKDQVICTKK